MSVNDLRKHGEPSWWLSVYDTTVKGIRDVGLPSAKNNVLAIEVPTLAEQARKIRQTRKVW